jgi:tRNA (mo5U34)-methyltransferase
MDRQLNDQALSTDDLRREIAGIRWFHQIDLGNGIVTPGHDSSAEKLPRLGIPADLRGKSVLDIGAWDGFFSFEAERRGAERVVAIDPNAWRAPVGPDNPWSGQEGFKLARRILGSKVEDVDIGLDELSPELIGQFDVVMFMGVFYHLPDPLPILERVASVTAERLILETHADLVWLRRPAMVYYPGTVLSADDSNYWGPNLALLRELLVSHGFRDVELVSRRSFPYRLARSIRWRLKGEPILTQQDRLVVHGLR